MEDLSAVTRIRLRRFIGGYRREDVHAVLRDLEDRLRRLDFQFEQAMARIRETEAELARTREQLAASHRREQQLELERDAARLHAEEIETAARLRAEAIVAGAEADAARIRGEAHLRVEDTGRHLDELLGLKQTMLDSVRAAVAEVQAVLARIERGRAPAEPAAAQTVPAQVESPPQLPTLPVEPGAPEPGDDIVFEQRVEIEAGPFGDFASLSAFERALARLPKVEDVYIRRFADETAAIEVTLSEPDVLLAHMRRMLPYDLAVEEADATRARLVVRAPSLASTG